MNKAEIIERHGEAEYARVLERCRVYYEEHRGEVKANNRKYREEHPEEVIAKNQRTQPEQCRKGGKYYDKQLKAHQTGLQGAKHKIRVKHANQYRPYKQIIAPDSQLHHEWVPKTAEYRGLALVEAEQHMHGFVDVIEILDGEIKLLSEEEVKRGKKREKEGLQAG